VLPTGQVVDDAPEDMVPTKDVVTPMPVTVDRTRTIDIAIVRRRYFDE
jgi:hypothetical protein